MAFDRNRGFTARPTYEHDEIAGEYRGVDWKINKNGTVTFKKDVPDSKDGEYDEITVPANLIFRVMNLLNNTKKVKFNDKS